MAALVSLSTLIAVYFRSSVMVIIMFVMPDPLSNKHYNTHHKQNSNSYTFDNIIPEERSKVAGRTSQFALNVSRTKTLGVYQ